VSRREKRKGTYLEMILSLTVSSVFWEWSRHLLESEDLKLSSLFWDSLKLTLTSVIGRRRILAVRVWGEENIYV
jgi:hypothetical protein